MVSFDDVKKLRAETGLSIGQCKKSLEDADGDKARELLIKVHGNYCVKKVQWRRKKSIQGFGCWCCFCIHTQYKNSWNHS